mmetsp:Transcript_14412/g.36482  ORF Transcript_14412/g.36482 Transcript_14412/m.36482 type:complete len:152 (-) Transcript_14412:60-515(-)
MSKSLLVLLSGPLVELWLAVLWVHWRAQRPAEQAPERSPRNRRWLCSASCPTPMRAQRNPSVGVQLTGAGHWRCLRSSLSSSWPAAPITAQQSPSFAETPLSSTPQGGSHGDGGLCCSACREYLHGSLVVFRRVCARQPGALQVDRDGGSS